mmetsp:Transcript_34212/g.89975  ORF Transcript_34212/g.89975 Transcript_34212/m.89975 type:complete len:96 (+) Transcript_34212:871-1158(+)
MSKVNHGRQTTQPMCLSAHAISSSTSVSVEPLCDLSDSSAASRAAPFGPAAIFDGSPAACTTDAQIFKDEGNVGSVFDLRSAHISMLRPHLEFST